MLRTIQAERRESPRKGFLLMASVSDLRSVAKGSLRGEKTGPRGNLPVVLKVRRELVLDHMEERTCNEGGDG